MSTSKNPKDYCPECGQKWSSSSSIHKGKSSEENHAIENTDLKPTSEDLSGFIDSEPDNEPFDFLVPSDTDESDSEWKWRKRYGEGWDCEDLECRWFASQSRVLTGKGTVVANPPRKVAGGGEADDGVRKNDDGGVAMLAEDKDGDEDGAVGKRSVAMVEKQMKEKK